MNPKFPDQGTKPKRRNSLRHPGADYAAPGAYFLTMCTQNRKPIYGKIVDERMVLNRFGAIVWKVWKSLPDKFPQISIDTAIVMPDHFHGIVIIHETAQFDQLSNPVGENHEFPLQDQNPQQDHFPKTRVERRVMTIPLIVGYFKMNTAKQINQIRGVTGERVWQRNYYDRILRDDLDYDSLSEYILTNPKRWGMDKD